MTIDQVQAFIDDYASDHDMIVSPSTTDGFARITTRAHFSFTLLRLLDRAGAKIVGVSTTPDSNELYALIDLTSA